MQTKSLGNSSVSISAIGLGGMPLSLSGRPSETDAIAVIHRALDQGVTLIDTADAYCKDETDKHHNERLIHKALQQYQGDKSQVIVATKGGLMRPGGSWTRNGNPDHLRQTIQASFEALGGKPIDLWQYHSPDPAYAIQDSLTPVRDAVAAGLIRYVGVSNFSVEQIQQAQEVVELVSVQNQYNPWHRQPEQDGVLAYCEQAKLTFLPWSPLGGSRRVQQLPELEPVAQLAQEKGISVYCLVLAWLCAKSPCVVPIPGASKVESIIDSVKAAEINLSPAEVEQIDQATSV
jgi:aryl-alcohol dehydrogenase-like predicted oxidoreductase